MLNLLQRTERGFALLGRWMVVCFMAITLVFTAGQAADRYVLHSPFNAYDQIATLALVWLTFIGIILAFRDHANVRVDLIDGWLGPGLLRSRNVLSDLAILAVLIMIQIKIWRLVELGSQQAIVGTPFSSDATYLALAVGSGFGIVVVTVRLVLDLTGRPSPQC